MIALAVGELTFNRWFQNQSEKMKNPKFGNFASCLLFIVT